MTYDSPREVLKLADSYRATSRAADSARVKIRTGGHRVEVRSGLLGLRKTNSSEATVFSKEETDAIYEALLVVSDDNERKANELEKKVVVKERQ